MTAGTDRASEPGPFDIIGDVHGCFDELVELLGVLGHALSPGATGARHRDGRRAVFVGDLVNRGPATPAVLRLAMGMVSSGNALCVLGNHDAMLLEALRSGFAAERPRAGPVAHMAPAHGLAESLDQLAVEAPEFLARAAAFLDGLAPHLVLDGGKLVVAHDGVPAGLVGGPPEGAVVVYGHKPVDGPVWVNGTICIDTGCVYGGTLTALRYPERELVRVASRRTYWLPAHRRRPAL